MNIQKQTLFISCKSELCRLSSGCVKCLESTDMSCSIRNHPEVLYKQPKVALDSYAHTLDLVFMSTFNDQIMSIGSIRLRLQI